MCGIAGIYFKEKVPYDVDTVNSFVKKLLVGIEPRGRHATGVLGVGWGGKGITLDKQPIDATEFVEKWEPFTEIPRIILLHTRWATQGDPKENNNNHPVRYRGVYTTHNGVITNDDALFGDTKNSLKRYAEVDSEIIPAMLWKHGFKKAGKAFEELRGGFATASVQPGKSPDQLLLAQGGNYPLVVHENKQFIVWASTRTAIEDAWKGTFKLDDDKKVPDWVSYNWFKSGEIWLVQDGKVTKKDFNHSTGVTRRSSTSNSRGYTGSAPSGDEWEDWNGGYNTTSYGGNYAQNGVFAEEVKEVRAKAQSAVTVLPNYQDRSEQEKATGFSEYCHTCRETIVKSDFRTVTNYGRICRDCAVFANDKNANPDIPILEEEVIHRLEEYAMYEEMVNEDAIKAVARSTGYDTGVVEYLIWRIPSRYISREPKAKELQRLLRELYKKECLAYWAFFLDTGDGQGMDSDEPILTYNDRMAAKRAELESRTLARSQVAGAAGSSGSEDEGEASNGTGGDSAPLRLFINCAQHGTVLIRNSKEGCPECIKKDSEEVKPLFSVVPRALDGRRELPCPMCQSDTGIRPTGWVLKKGYWYCLKHEHVNESFYQFNTNKPIDEAIIASLSETVRAITPRHPGKLEEDTPENCGVEAFACGVEDECHQGNCEASPVATLSDGSRACHKHVRNQKGAKFDVKTTVVSVPGPVLH